MKFYILPFKKIRSAMWQRKNNLAAAITVTLNIIWTWISESHVLSQTLLVDSTFMLWNFNITRNRNSLQSIWMSISSLCCNQNVVDEKVTNVLLQHMSSPQNFMPVSYVDVLTHHLKRFITGWINSWCKTFMKS